MCIASTSSDLCGISLCAARTMAMDFAASLDAMLNKGRSKAAEQEAAVGAVKPVKSMADVKREMAAAKSKWETETAKAAKSSILTVTAKPMPLGVSVKKETANVLTAVTKGGQASKLGLKVGLKVVKLLLKGLLKKSQKLRIVIQENSLKIC